VNANFVAVTDASATPQPSVYTASRIRPNAASGIRDAEEPALSGWWGALPTPAVWPIKISDAKTEYDSRCGTLAGYQRHRRHGEPTCFDCREAKRLYEATKRGGRLARRELKPCGTVAAYKRHLYHKEPPCEPCRQANLQYRRSRKRG